MSEDTDKILDDYIADWNARIGESKPVGVHRTSHRQYCMSSRHVTDDLIRNFAVCHGDANPLWRDRDYAEASPWGKIIGPPAQLMSLSAAAILPPPPPIKNWTMMAAGAEYTIDRPLVHGDEIDGTDVWVGFVERSKPDRPHRTFVLTAERRFTDQKGQSVGKLAMRAFAMAPRSGQDAGDGPKGPPPRERPCYSEEQLQEIYAHYDAENAGQLRRGAEPRFWEDVNEGDDIGKLIKGPIDILDSASFIQMVGGGVGFADKWMLIKNELDLSPRDPVTNAYHFNFDWHLDDGSAQAMGQPYALVFGAQIEAHCSHLLTNWGGDHSMVRLMDNRIIAPMFLGETAHFAGKVSRKFEEDGRGLVEIAIQASQQDGIPVGTQRAIVQLPHRGRPDEVVQQVMGV
jgi:acyl dehydratase